MRTGCRCWEGGRDSESLMRPTWTSRPHWWRCGRNISSLEKQMSWKMRWVNHLQTYNICASSKGGPMSSWYAGSWKGEGDGEGTPWVSDGWLINESFWSKKFLTIQDVWGELGVSMSSLFSSRNMIDGWKIVPDGNGEVDSEYPLPTESATDDEDE